MTTDLMLLADPQREERLAKLREYNAYDHIKKWQVFNSSTGLTETVEYYPAGWRLYELGLRHPTANFAIEIIHMDPAKDFIILKARLFFGSVYEDSPKRAEAMKQGKFSQIDRVETKAKARAARDFGIGTEHALDMDDASEVVGTVVGSSLAQDERGVVNLATAQDRKNIQNLCTALKRECPPLDGMTSEQAAVTIKTLSEEVRVAHEEKKKQSAQKAAQNPPLLYKP